MAQRKPRKVFNGRDRQVIKKLEYAIYLIENMDSRLQVKAEQQDISVYVFSDGARTAQALDRLKERITATLALTQ